MSESVHVAIRSNSENTDSQREMLTEIMPQRQSCVHNL